MEQILQKLNDIDSRLSTLEEQFRQHTHTGLDSQVLLQIPSKLANAPQATILPPSGGVTVDAQSRATLIQLLSLVQTLGLMN